MLNTCKEFLPSAPLQRYVDSYTYQVFTGLGPREESPIQRCLPLGMTEIIIIVNNGEIFTLQNNRWDKMSKATFIGVYKDPALWKVVGDTVMFYVTLKPETLLHLFKVPVSVMFNNYTKLSNFLGKRAHVLEEKMYGEYCPQKLIATTEQFLLNCLKEADIHRSYLDDAINIIRKNKGILSIDELSREINVSERKLQRGFKDHYGVTPKTYTRIIRFRNAYESIQKLEKNKQTWAGISYDHGYADQAHFIRDFKEFSGSVPSIIYKEEKEQVYNDLAMAN